MSEKWWEQRCVAVDLETTGTDVFADRIVTAAVVHHTPGERPRTLSWVIDPGVPIPPEAADVHGWTDDKVKAHPRVRQPADALFEIAGQVALPMSLGVPLVAFNASFDLSMLEAECARHGVDTLASRLTPKGVRGVVDPFVIDKHYSRRKGSRRLGDQCDYYKVLHAGTHDAGADALASVRLVARLVACYPELRRLSLPQLHAAQVGWRREQMDSLRAYFDGKNIEHDGCDGSWPIRTAPAAEAVS